MTTFVTSFINIYNNNNENSNESNTFRIEKLMELVNTGINLCIYVDSTIIDNVTEKTSKYLNVKVMRTVSLCDLFSFKVCSSVNELKLPFTDNEKKDTKEYMMLMNSKIEFIHDAIQHNVFRTNNFAWIDFSISKIFTSTNYITVLNEINNMKYNGKILAIPGCRNKLLSEPNININDEIRNDLSSICWRFCGGFFLGDKDSLENFYDKYIELFPKFIQKYKMIVWEVNFWAWMECNSNCNWEPNWYSANHDDSIIEIPHTFTATSIISKSTIKVYDYPILDDGLYVPSSASYLRYNGKHILNTRYVNYSIINKEYVFHNSEPIIITKNVMSYLNDDLLPINYDIIDDPDTITREIMMYNGVEDIRLFEKNGKINYLGTSLSHSTSGKNAMVTGIYNCSSLKMENCITIDSPYDRCCEKNWTPIIKKDIHMVVYKWYPMEIFTVNNTFLNNDRCYLEKFLVYNIKNSIFRMFRGSSLFIKIGDNLLGLVHFSEGEYMDRRYFHVLVLLDGESMKPIKYSESFYFGKDVGIEFCTGFAIINMKYQFWVSFNDRNPQNISINIDSIPLCNNILFC